MSAPKFQFSNVVVVKTDLIGVVVKTWEKRETFTYEVYVRAYNEIREYWESEIQHYIYSKELLPDELYFYA